MKRSIHHLGERETLIKLFEENGFEVDYCWHYEVVDPLFDDQDLESHVFKSPEYSSAFEQLGPEKTEKVIEATKKAFYELKKNYIPLVIEQTCLVARKP